MLFLAFIFKRAAFKEDAAPLPAYHGAKPPSKPVRPHVR